MNSFNLLVSPLSGIGVLIALFSLCFLTVIGAKTVYTKFLENYFASKKAELKVKRKRRKIKTVKVNPVKSIEINPDEIDRIYVKKSS